MVSCPAAWLQNGRAKVLRTPRHRPLGHRQPRAGLMGACRPLQKHRHVALLIKSAPQQVLQLRGHVVWDLVLYSRDAGQHILQGKQDRWAGAQLAAAPLAMGSGNSMPCKSTLCSGWGGAAHAAMAQQSDGPEGRQRSRLVAADTAGKACARACAPAPLCARPLRLPLAQRGTAPHTSCTAPHPGSTRQPAQGCRARSATA